MNRILLIIFVLLGKFSLAGNDSTSTKTSKWPIKFCAPRIVGMSPNKVISLGYDYEFSQTLKSSDIGSFDKKAQPPIVETTKFKHVSGLRFTAKIPIINKPKIIWQVGLNYWKSNYKVENTTTNIWGTPFGGSLGKKGLTTSGISTSIYKPLNERHFIIFQTSADMNGDYQFSKPRRIDNLMKYSFIAFIGRRPNDYKQWAVGFGRTYGAGQSSLLPLVIYNYTAPNKKWGTEITLPARAWYRRPINKNSLLRAGYELEGASYHLNFLSPFGDNNFELRRGELRIKMEYQCKLYKAFWLAAQTGYCTILNYKVDDLESSGKDFTRNISGNHNYAMINKLSDFLFLNLSINLVSL